MCLARKRKCDCTIDNKDNYPLTQSVPHREHRMYPYDQLVNVE
jgi:hypothetical protein